MSVRCSAWVLHESPSTGNSRLVLIAIADEADDEGRNAFPGVDLIAHKARVDRSTALRAITRLEADGELLVRRPDTRGRGRFNRYTVVMGRDPVALAGVLGWPPPALNEASRDRWQIATLPDTPQPVTNSVDDDHDESRKGSETLQIVAGKVAPGATRPLDPLTPGSLGSSDPQAARFRRGLDRPPDVAQADQLAAAQHAHAARQQAEHRERMADAAASPNTPAIARALREQLHAEHDAAAS